MPRPQKALISFEKYSDSLIIIICQFIIAGMTGNAFFPTPTPALPGLVTLLEDYTKALKACGAQDRNKIAIKNALRLQLNAAFNQLGIYVNLECMGNVEKLTSSGFRLSKVPEPVHLETPTGLVVTPGINPGTMDASVNRVAGASGYLFERCDDINVAEPLWVIFGSVRCNYTFTGLVPGKTYYVRVVALGANEQSTYSTVAMQVAAV